MAITFNEDGTVEIADTDTYACPVDPMDALQCDSCQ